MNSNYFLILLSGFLVGSFLLFLLKGISSKYQWLVSPKQVPFIGGIAVVTAFICASFFGFSLYGILSKETAGIIISSFVMFVFGLIDDWRELSVLAKIFVQTIATSLLVVFGVKTQIVYIGDGINIILTFIWVLGVTNAFNHLDVMDGVAGGNAVIISLAFFIVSFLSGNLNTAVLSLALTGAVIGFLFYNLPPAKVYLGNSGSHFLGFILAALALIIDYGSLERKAALITPVLILWFPIFDSIFLIFMRMTKGRLFFKKSDDHLALRFLKLGYSKNKALLAMLVLSSFFSLSGILVSKGSNLQSMIIVVFVFLVSIFVKKWMGKVVING